MRLDIHYLTWQVVAALKKLGIFGLLGIVITLGCCLFYLVQLLPQQSKIQNLSNQIQLANTSINDSKNNKKIDEKNNVSAEQASVNDIEKFYAIFSEGTSLPSAVDIIRENAQKQKLILPRGDYKLIQTKISQQASSPVGQPSNLLARYEMVLPITGTYQQVRSFMAQVLYQLPALALADIQLKRENTLSPIVDARLTFIFLLQDNSLQKHATQLGQL